MLRNEFKGWKDGFWIKIPDTSDENGPNYHFKLSRFSKK